MTRRDAFLRVYSVLVFFTVFAGDFWRYTIGWAGFAVVATALASIAVVLLVRGRRRLRIEWFPFPLLAFLALAALSFAWSYYPGATALGLLATGITVLITAALAFNLTWEQLMWALGLAMRLVLGLSFAFEFIVSAFVRHPVLPLVAQPGIDYSSLEKVPKLLYWSRDLLFEGGKIQGIVGNSSLLAFVALIGLIVFSVQFAAKATNRIRTGIWIVIAVVAIACTRSPTIYVAIVVLLITLAFVLLLRRTSGRAKVLVYGSALGVVAALVVTINVAGEQLLALVGKSPDLTGRLDIWNAVIALAEQRPVAGWGWVGYWVPWVAPFDTLAFEGGVRQLHAHNAWLDIWMQLGVIGLVVFGALVLSTGVRSMQFAISSDRREPGVEGHFRAITLLPLLIVLALLVQSVAESRLLVEYGLVMLTLVAIKTKNAKD